MENESGYVGRKDDKGKVRWYLLPFAQVQTIVLVLMHGESKYSAENWKKVPDPGKRYFGAVMRHLTAWHSGEKKDQETGISHLAHACCNLIFLMWFDDQAEEKDTEQKAEMTITCECGGKMDRTLDIVKGHKASVGWECGRCHRTILMSHGDI